jgi:hypothetical protein
MAKRRNIVEQLADVGEEAIQRIGSAPGADRVLGAVGSLREGVGDLQKRMRGVEGFEKRLKSLERRLDKLEGKGKTTTRKTASSAKSSTAKRSTTRKGSTSS